MKKLVTVLLTACLLLSAAGCAKPAYALALPEYTKKGDWAPRDLQAELNPYLTAVIPALLEDGQRENLLCSPLNIYMAMAMLAEVTAGETRVQVLAALASPGVEELRLQASYLWRSSYQNGEKVKRILGSSLWLNEDLAYDGQTVDTLAADYFASVYQGEMGSEELNETYRRWMNDNTGGLLQNQISGLKLDKDLCCALAATVYFKSAWQTEFAQSATRDEPFYSSDGETLVPMMHRTEFGDYYWGEGFSAVSKAMDGGKMWFILPDEDLLPADLLQREQALQFLINYRSLPAENHRYVKIHLTVPKYDVESKLDLRPVMKKLGVIQAFDPQMADFSALLPEDPAFVGAMTHGVRVIVDEKQVEAAAYTQVATPSAAPLPPDVEEIWFTADRPFLFVITGADDLPLFVGVIQQP